MWWCSPSQARQRRPGRPRRSQARRRRYQARRRRYEALSRAGPQIPSSTFEDLIGQDAMVRDVSNAFATGRIPQAWILTGVRGVGKTTTARILARASNYELPDGSVKGPTIHMPQLGVHCQAIMESGTWMCWRWTPPRTPASTTSARSTRAVRYAPASARYKVYIIDEVHMLSTAAFNALPEDAGRAAAACQVHRSPPPRSARCR